MSHKAKDVTTYLSVDAARTNLDKILGHISAIMSADSSSYDGSIARHAGMVQSGRFIVDMEEDRDALEAIRDTDHTPESQALFDQHNFYLAVYQNFYNFWLFSEYPGHEKLNQQGVENCLSYVFEIISFGMSFSFHFKDGKTVNVILTSSFLDSAHYEKSGALEIVSHSS